MRLPDPSDLAVIETHYPGADGRSIFESPQALGLISIQPRLNGGTGRAEFVADLVSGLAIDHPQNDVGTLDLSDSQAEDSIYDGESMRRFVGVKLGVDRVPDEMTILRFRQLFGSTVYDEGSGPWTLGPPWEKAPHRRANDSARS